MITALDHIVLLCQDFEKTVSEYETLFGSTPHWKSQDAYFNAASFQTGNTALEIIAPVKASQAQERVSQILESRDSALTTMAFAVDDIQNSHHLFSRRGLEPSDITNGTMRMNLHRFTVY